MQAIVIQRRTIRCGDPVLPDIQPHIDVITFREQPAVSPTNRIEIQSHTRVFIQIVTADMPFNGHGTQKVSLTQQPTHRTVGTIRGHQPAGLIAVSLTGGHRQTVVILPD